MGVHGLRAERASQVAALFLVAWFGITSLGAAPPDRPGLAGVGGTASSLLLDLNGDGKGDVLTYQRTTGQWVRAVTQPGGGFLETTGIWAAGWSIMPARFDNDALTDLLLFNDATGEWAKMLNDGSGFTEQATGTWWPGWQKFVLDLDGDGPSDVFLYDPATGTWFKCISTSSGFSYVQGGWSPDWEVTLMTLNDDALGDMFLINRTTGRWFWVLGDAGGGFTYPVTETWFASWNLYPGDFNGDGLSDLLLHYPTTGTYFVAMNTGSGFSYTQDGWSLGWSPYVADLDGDGADDLFLHDAATGVWFEMISNGAGNFSNAGGETWSLGWRIEATDFNGDGRADLLLYDPATGVWYQARNLVLGSFDFSSGTWAQGLTVVTQTASQWKVTSPPPAPCLITTADLTIGNTTMSLNGCGAAVGGNLAGTNPSARVIGTPTPQVNVTGTCVGTCSAMGTLKTGAAQPVDPLAGLVAPTNPGGCVVGTATTLNPGCYTAIVDTVTTLNPGIYYVTGRVDIGNLTGTNVMLYLVGSGQLTSLQNKQLTLSAPVAGPYKGVAIFQDPSNSNPIDLQNNFTLSVFGAIYMPGVSVDFKNSVTMPDTGCTLVVARSLIVKNGNWTLSNSSCAAAYGGVQ